ILTFLLSGIVFSLNAQSPDIEWQRSYGGITDDELHVIIQTTDNNFIFGGNVSNSPSGNLTEDVVPSYQFDYYFIKLDEDGNEIWQRSFGGSNDDRLRAMSATPDGGFIAGGYSYSNATGDKSENLIGPNGEADYWIIKCDAAGEIEWEESYGGDERDQLYTMILLNDGYLISGYSSSSASGDKSEGVVVLPKNYDWWIIKIDFSGNIIWDQTIGGSKNDYPNDLCIANDGGYIVAGNSLSGTSGDKTEANMGAGGTGDLWIIKLDTDGNIVWQNTIGGHLHEELPEIVAIPTGGYAIETTSKSPASGDKSENNYTTSVPDYWVLKIDNSGNVVWENTIWAGYYEYSPAIVLSPDGGFLLAGQSGSNAGGDKTENNYGGGGGFDLDHWIIKLDASGNIVWDKTIGANLHEFFTDAFTDPDGSYYLGGYSYSGVNGLKTDPAFGGADYWIVKLEPDCDELLSTVTVDGPLSFCKGSSVTLTSDDVGYIYQWKKMVL
ncbi:MAG: hypothetical protein ACHQFW_11260, partial [Chitinophagales bacterium]